MSAIVAAGLRLEFPHELDFSLFQHFSALRGDGGGRFWYPAGQPRVPLMYSLRATLPL